MKNRKINKKVLAAAFGAVLGGISAGMNIVSLLPGLIQTGKQALFGSEGEYTSFTDGVLPTGGLFNSRSGERRRMQANLAGNRAAVAGTAMLQSDAAMDNVGMNESTIGLAVGGYVPMTTALLTPHEIGKTPSGEVFEVMGEGNEDTELVRTETNTHILKPKYSKIYKKMAGKISKNPQDKYAENTNELNNKSNKVLHDKLFATQLTENAKKGIKPKFKSIEGTNLGKTQAAKDGAVLETMNTISQVLPAAYNIFQGAKGAQKERPYYNPYEQASLNLLSKNYTTGDDQVRDVNRISATANYNAGQYNTNTGANMAFRLQNAYNTQNQIRNIRQSVNAANNQHRAALASAYSTFGQQRAAAEADAMQRYQLNQAAANSLVGTGLKGIADAFGTFYKDYNAKQAQKVIAPAMINMLNRVYTKEDFNKIVGPLSNYLDFELPLIPTQNAG